MLRRKSRELNSRRLKDERPKTRPQNFRKSTGAPSLEAICGIFCRAAFLPFPSNPRSFLVAEWGGGHCGPMRHFVTRQRINVNVASARLLARMCLLVPSPPPPPPLNRSRSGPPCRRRPQIRGRTAGEPTALPRSPQPSCTSKEPPVQPKEKAIRARDPEQASQGPLPSPSHRPSQRRARDGQPVHPASPLPPSQTPPCGPLPINPPLSP